MTVVLCTDGASGETMRSVLACRYEAFDVVVVSHAADLDETRSSPSTGDR